LIINSASEPVEHSTGGPLPKASRAPPGGNDALAVWSEGYRLAVSGDAQAQCAQPGDGIIGQWIAIEIDWPLANLQLVIICLPERASILPTAQADKHYAEG
jgi:hypothetical protein